MYIKNMRQKRHLSQEKLAELCGLSLRTIQRVESGHRIGSASLRALATEFQIDVETLEEELMMIEEKSSEYKDLPFWLRFSLGRGWFAATREEIQKVELFNLAMMSLFLVARVGVQFWGDHPESIKTILVLGCFTCLIGVYHCSFNIRMGDKYDVWSRLDGTLPKRGLFGLSKKVI